MLKESLELVTTACMIRGIFRFGEVVAKSEMIGEIGSAGIQNRVFRGLANIAVQATVLPVVAEVEGARGFAGDMRRGYNYLASKCRRQLVAA